MFRVPLAGAGLPPGQTPYRGRSDLFGMLSSVTVQKDFLNNVAKFFCEFPIRPSEVSVKMLPVKVEWNLDTICKKVL